MIQRSHEGNLILLASATEKFTFYFHMFFGCALPKPLQRLFLNSSDVCLRIVRRRKISAANLDNILDTIATNYLSNESNISFD